MNVCAGAGVNVCWGWGEDLLGMGECLFGGGVNVCAGGGVKVCWGWGEGLLGVG